MRKKEIILRISDFENPSTGYVYLPNHPGKDNYGVAVRQVGIRELIKDYRGVDLYFDFDENDELIGIEIIGDDD